MRTVDVDPVEVWLGDRYYFDEYSPRTEGMEDATIPFSKA